MTPLLPALTDREEQVLLLLAEGHGPREIALRMGIAPSTVRGYRDTARGKLGAATTTQAVAILVRFRVEVG